ncbi:Uncharacterised protein [Streptococcus porcinus]|uniref:hypothetical protein n=1 Tax=Streptococcus porcinus TaxID=1340 RepID=UPI0010CACA78|nr:hypothetical protein [Streptococcus porcinus]VTS39050.1 Uncharacterised protein [Streptococcus porcinus]
MAFKRKETVIPSSTLRISKEKKKLYNQDFFDLTSSVELLDVKSILNTKDEHISLVDYGYLQLLEIPGKDLGSLSHNEILRTIYNFEKWLTDFNSNIQIETTTLPTNTDSQIADMKRWLSIVREKKSLAEIGSRYYNQLDDREARLLGSIQTEENIQKEIYNAEFILWLFAPTTTELDDLVRKAQSYGNNDFVPQKISRRKKEQILKQYNNMNEKI